MLFSEEKALAKETQKTRCVRDGERKVLLGLTLVLLTRGTFLFESLFFFFLLVCTDFDILSIYDINNSTINTKS